MSSHVLNKQQQDILFQWWKDLENNKGTRAELRRIQQPDNVAFVKQASMLCYDLKRLNDRSDFDKCLALIGLCSHIKTVIPDGTSFGAYLAGSGADSPRISESRFKRLLTIDDRNELYRALIRIVRQCDGIVPMMDMFDIVYWWNDKAKRELAKEYYRLFTKSRNDADNDTNENN